MFNIVNGTGRPVCFGGECDYECEDKDTIGNGRPARAAAAAAEVDRDAAYSRLPST